MKIVHIINNLDSGGAENALFKICKYDTENKHIVISLQGPGRYFKPLSKEGIKVYFLKARFYSIYKFFYLVRLLIFIKPDIVQTWLVHSDFIGGIAARLAGIKNISWNIRFSNLEIRKIKLSTTIIIKILSILSYFIPKFIIVNSKRGKKTYEYMGYDKKKLKFIPNGYDLLILKPNKFEKKAFKEKIKIKKNIPLIGNVARYDLLKDHMNLLKALSIARSKKKIFYCILVGSNINKNKKLINQIIKLKLNKHIKLIGSQMNISKVMNGIDIHVLSSLSEGFPNVVAEAMACGTPCVSTDVGDARFIVGNTGWIVSPSNPNKLANAIEKALSELSTNNWKKRSREGRARIKKYYNILRMIHLYNKLWKKLLINNS